jgi:hypothetical protein
MQNFKEMSRDELKAYIRKHPTDDDAMRELFVNLRSPNTKQYPYPYDMAVQDVEAIFREKISQIEQGE